MEKIVQLTEKEYKELTETAQMNADEITRKAELLWETKGLAEVKLEIQLRDKNRWTYPPYEIKCSGYTYIPNETEFGLPHDLEESITKYFKNHVLTVMRQEYGTGVHLENVYREAEKNLNSVRKEIYTVAFAGWGAFIGCLMYLIFG